MAPPRPLRVVLIGYGFAGRVFHAPLIQAVPGLSLDFVASRDATKVHADIPGVEVLADPMSAATDPRADLVVIASPNDSHVPLARAALQAGRNVVVDKPFALSLADARELAALAAAKGRLLSVFQNRRWDSDFLAVRRAVEDGLIGEPMHLESRMERYRPQVRDRWREAAGPGGGVLWDLAPHLVDQAMQLLGRPDSVYADVAAQRSDAQTDDWAHLVLAFGRRRAVLQIGMLAAGGGARFLVHGTRGTIVKAMPDPQEAQLLAGVRPGDAEWGQDSDELLVLAADEPARRVPAPRGDQSRYYAAVCEALRGRGDNPVAPAQAVAVMAVLEAAVISAREGRAMAPDFDVAEPGTGAWES
ncbi:oxidoreductase [Lysobacter niabensis]|uniref:oxidoreductase n=1 Tax=Agrilutibacter niabensis TaxID=380628 RepID=UPI0036063E6D